MNTFIYNLFAEIQLQISNINERNELSISQQLYKGNCTFDMALDQPVAAADWLTRPSVTIDQLICRLQQKGLDYLYMFLQANMAVSNYFMLIPNSVFLPKEKV